MRTCDRILLLCLVTGCASTVGGSVDAGSAIVATEIARACLLAVGCAAAPVGSLGACVQSMTRRALAPQVTREVLWDRLLACAARPSSRATCDAFVECATLGHPAAYCAAHPGGSCDGAIAVQCAPSRAPATVDDCATIPGARCASESALGLPGTATFCAAGCSPTCAGNVAELSCAGVADRANRCTAGTTCLISPRFAGIYGACLPPGPACSVAGRRCEGSVLVQCVGVFETLLRETRSDCARLGWQCVGATCVPPPFACALDAPPACEGDTLVACAAGSDPRFDCRALGFSRCAPPTNSSPARCEP